jgi:poly-beta-hydroxybutyrate-responsive repressor
VSDGIFEAPSTEWLVPFLLLNLRELVPFLLLNLRERAHYGYELMQRMPGFGTTHPGVMDRSLRQMEKEGMVFSEYDGLDGELSRRRYSIMESGRACLERWANSLEECQKKIDLFLSVYEGSAPGVCGCGTGREEQ